MDSVPLPLPDEPNDVDECRLWVGNLDTRITEFSLLKLLQKYGELKKFDFLYHKAGPDVGQPRGYCFVTYASREGRDAAIKQLNGKKALSKKLLVKPANSEKDDSEKKTNGSSSAGQTSKSQNPSSQIRAIEAKLQAMKDTNADVTSLLNKTTTEVPKHPALIQASSSLNQPRTDSRRHHHPYRSKANHSKHCKR